MTDDATKAAIDSMLYGHGFLKDGKHIPADQVYVAPPEEHPNATDYRNRGERDAAYWRDMCAELVFSTGTDLDRARIAVVEELARINAEALR